MVTAVFAAVLVNLVLFGTLATWAVLAARREESDRIRPLLWVMAAVATAFVLSALTRLLLVAARLELVPGRVDALVGSEWVFVQALLASALGVTAWLVLRRVGGSLARADRVASTLSERLVDGGGMDELDLTRREREVVDLLVQGVMSDRDIADQLVISPATAGTHVRNVLRKADLHDRRELALLALSSRD
ncbi:helix-turn-helix transcriptional regulator [Salsipaludibacter albus]|uniref:helix-turn-helix transcriptional regulator n=1 Tax=Salsipaludibacter albus TaxID=2849650 RepID=UPI001EE4D57B|nr:helix-turn-helix transcriptional regulator [Salsipaludibacter albus]MBY5164202.1 helix-turn-helix transcriptional regulator [Salsipaludibacter albus]